MTQEKPEKFNQEKDKPELAPDYGQEIPLEDPEISGEVVNGPDWDKAPLWQMGTTGFEEKQEFGKVVWEKSQQEAKELQKKYGFSEERMEKVNEGLRLLRNVSTFGSNSHRAVEFLLLEGFEGEEDKELFKKTMQDAFIEGLLHAAVVGGGLYWEEVVKVKNILDIPDDAFKDKIFLKNLDEVMSVRQHRGSLTFLSELVEQFGLSEEFFEIPQVRSVLKAGLSQEIRSGDGRMAIEHFGFSEEEVYDATRTALLSKLEEHKEFPGRRIIVAGGGKQLDGREDILGIYAQESVKKRLLADSEILQKAKEVIIEYISLGHSEKIGPLLEDFGLSENVLKEPEMLEAAKEAMVSKLKAGDISKTMNIIEAMDLEDNILEEEEMVKAAEEGFEFAVKDSPEDIYRYNNIPISQDVKKKGIETSLSFFLSGGAAIDVKKILEGLVGHVIGNMEPEESANKLKEHFDLEKIDEDFVLETGEKSFFQPIYFIEILDSELFANCFPKTFEYAKERIFEKLSEDEDLADFFIEKSIDYINAPWLEEKHIKDALSHPSVAQKFYWHYQSVEEVVGEDKVLPKQKDMLGLAKEVMEEYGLSTNLEDRGRKTFSKEDPYKEHKWLFTAEKARAAGIVERLMAGEDVSSEELKEVGIETELRRGNLFEKINEHVYENYLEFVREVESNNSLSPEDIESIAFPDMADVPLNSFLDNLRSFVARYVVQEYGDDIAGDLNIINPQNVINSFDPVLKEALRRYMQVLETDVPYYDKLYEEFDNWRESGRYPMEVYLGRDGIYAYIGRRAQDIARRRKLGPEGRREAKEERGEVLEINPKYLVYPRYFRDAMAYTAKNKFLEQERISIEHDPMFYDTGFTGSIPEQIMRVMDFPEEEIEKRIRLLSASKAGRRVRGVGENARSEIVNYIEGNAKTEETAKGLLIDNQTGKIRHIAEPTMPKEQFYFNVVKQAIERHYWVKEYKNYELSGNINIDSETHKLRLRQDYMPVIPEGLTEKPGEFIEQNGESLKEVRGGSKGESISLKLDDGTEIIAKRVSPERVDEERKEYAILVSAQNANLPGAEPVGYVEAKNDDGADYVLMTKVNGLSGENIKEHLENLEDLSEKDISGIMDEIVEKNKELAEEYREILRVDKRWQIKDTIIQLDENSGQVEEVIPIDWEEAGNYDPKFPGEVDTIA